MRIIKLSNCIRKLGLFQQRNSFEKTKPGNYIMQFKKVWETTKLKVTIDFYQPDRHKFIKKCISKPASIQKEIYGIFHCLDKRNLKEH